MRRLKWTPKQRRKLAWKRRKYANISVSRFPKVVSSVFTQQKYLACERTQCGNSPVRGLSMVVLSIFTQQKYLVCERRNVQVFLLQTSYRYAINVYAIEEVFASILNSGPSNVLSLWEEGLEHNVIHTSTKQAGLLHDVTYTGSSKTPEKRDLQGSWQKDGTSGALMTSNFWLKSGPDRRCQSTQHEGLAPAERSRARSRPRVVVLTA